MVRSHTAATGLHIRKTRIAEDRLIATIRARTIYIALVHTLLVIKFRNKKTNGIGEYAGKYEYWNLYISQLYSFTANFICLDDR